MRFAPWLLAAVVVLLASGSCIPAVTFDHAPGVLAAEDPVQREIDSAPLIERGAFRLRPRAEFSATVRVLRARTIRWATLAELVPTDFAVGWGPMSDSRCSRTCEITQANRFYFWRTEHWPIERAEIESHSANWHVIPENAAVRAVLGKLRARQRRRARGRAGRHRRRGWLHAHFVDAQRHGRRRLRGTAGRLARASSESETNESSRSMVSRSARATVADVEALTEFGARTFFESFAADNTPEDMEKHLASAWRPDLQRAEILDPKIDTLLAAVERCARGIRAVAGPGSAAGRSSGHQAGRALALLRRQALAGRGLARALMSAAERPRARARRARAVARRLGAQRARAGVLSQVRLRDGWTAGFRRGHGSADGSRHAAVARDARIEHIGVWVRDIDVVAAFYARHFGARIGERYENPRKGFASRFLQFDGGARLELMTRVDVTGRAQRRAARTRARGDRACRDEAAVDALAASLRAAGVPVLDGPRRTGDGYYECVGAGSGRQSRGDRGRCRGRKESR